MVGKPEVIRSFACELNAVWHVLPKGEVVRWQLEENGCLRSCVAY